ncbi:MAG: hypothetical protein MUO50_04230, partial [Longimicrobiales bacterium]|nr:hypothetical protein [Longimicrobiales bacterium]
EAVNQIGSFFYGSLLGVFLLAFFVPRSNGTGASVGLLVGMASVFLVSFTTEISWLYYNVVGAAVVVTIGVLMRDGSGEGEIKEYGAAGTPA